MRVPISQNIMDYTAVPAGLRIEGRLSSGQLTEGTAQCPKCGRIGVITSPRSGKPMVVHTGRTEGKTLSGIDVCYLVLEQQCLSIVSDSDRRGAESS